MLRKLSLLIAVCTSITAAWAAEVGQDEPPAGAMPEVTGAPTYGEAGAHAPRFADKSLWPKLSGEEYFLPEDWPAGRLYVWAHPGESGGIPGRNTPHDVTDPKNWLENGKPAGKLILDENTDLWFPPSKEPYHVGFRGTDMREVCRHVTIESGACFSGGGDGVGRTIYGNVWVKAGAGISSQGATRFVGGRHTFFRNDNTVHTARSPGRGGGIMSSQYFVFNKDNNRSVEFLGHVSVLDEFQVHACTVIVGVDSLLQTGRNASPAMHPGATLVLLDGATFESWNNDFGSPEMTVREGTIQGGLPERPLTRNCKFGLAHKNHTAAQYEHASEKMKSRKLRRVPSLVVHSGTLRSLSTDVERARLVFGEMTDASIAPAPGSERYESEIRRWPEKKAEFAWLSKLPRGLDCFLGKDVVVENVEFDHVRRGGIMYQNPETKAGWKGLVFGPNCLAQGEALFAHQEQLGRNGDY